MQNIKYDPSSRIADHLSKIFQEPLLPYQAWADQILGSATNIRPRQGEKLLAVDKTEEGFPVVVHYSPSAAAQLILSLIAGTLGAASPVLIACAVLSAVIALRGIKTETTQAEALLFWTIFTSDNRSSTREAAKLAFIEASQGTPGVGPRDFEVSLHSLTRLGCITTRGGLLQVAEPVVIRSETGLYLDA